MIVNFPEIDFEFFSNYLPIYCQQLKFNQSISKKLVLDLQSLDYKMKANYKLKSRKLKIGVMSNLQSKIISMVDKVHHDIKNYLEVAKQVFRDISQFQMNVQDLYILTYGSNNKSCYRHSILQQQIRDIELKISKLQLQKNKLDNLAKKQIYQKPHQYSNNKNNIEKQKYQQRIISYRKKKQILEKQYEVSFRFLSQQKKQMVVKIQDILTKINYNINNLLTNSNECKFSTFQRHQKSPRKEESQNQIDEKLINQFQQMQREIDGKKIEFIDKIGKKCLQDALMTSSRQAPQLTPNKLNINKNSCVSYESHDLEQN